MTRTLNTNSITEHKILICDLSQVTQVNWHYCEYRTYVKRALFKLVGPLRSQAYNDTSTS